MSLRSDIWWGIWFSLCHRTIIFHFPRPEERNEGLVFHLSSVLAIGRGCKQWKAEDSWEDPDDFQILSFIKSCSLGTLCHPSGPGVPESGVFPRLNALQLSEPPAREIWDLRGSFSQWRSEDLRAEPLFAFKEQDSVCEALGPFKAGAVRTWDKSFRRWNAGQEALWGLMKY